MIQQLTKQDHYDYGLRSTFYDLSFPIYGLRCMFYDLRFLRVTISVVFILSIPEWLENQDQFEPNRRIGSLVHRSILNQCLINCWVLGPKIFKQ